MLSNEIRCLGLSPWSSSKRILFFCYSSVRLIFPFFVQFFFILVCGINHTLIFPVIALLILFLIWNICLNCLQLVSSLICFFIHRVSICTVILCLFYCCLFVLHLVLIFPIVVFVLFICLQLF